MTFIRYSKHLKQYHEITPGFRVTCKIDGCRDSFTTVRYFVRHVYRKHPKNPMDYVTDLNLAYDDYDDVDSVTGSDCN